MNNEMDREWEKFRGGPTEAAQSRMHVTLNKRGILFMNRNTHRLMGRPSAVYLYYNRARDSIALAPSSPRLPESFPVTEKLSGWVIYSSPFCRHFGIKLDTTEKFTRPDLTTDGKLLLELSNTVTVSGIKRKRKK